MIFWQSKTPQDFTLRQISLRRNLSSCGDLVLDEHVKLALHRTSSHVFRGLHTQVSSTSLEAILGVAKRVCQGTVPEMKGRRGILQLY